jgi:dienelactone hydrolase
MRGILLNISSLAAVLVVLLSFAGTALGAVKTETITYEVGGQKFKGVLAWDDSVKGKRAGVLVCHEWWGNNDYSKSRAEQLAKLGYVVFALDMYGDGKTTTDVAKAQEWSKQLYSDPAVVRERAAAGLKVLASRPEVDASRVAAIGYCMGGTVALELARTGADLKAVVCFHTSALTAKDPADNKKIKAKVLVCHGAADPMTPSTMIAEFKKQMDEAKVSYRVIEYPGAKHSFTNPKADEFKIDGVGYNKEADEKSWADMRAFFAETIDKK